MTRRPSFTIAPTRRGFLTSLSAIPLVSVWARTPLGAAIIERIEVFAVRYPMVGHFKFFTGPHGGRGRASVLVKITGSDGTIGWGQSVPIARWSYETLETVEVCLRDYFGPALLGLALDEERVLERADALMDGAVAPGFSTGMPIARAGADLALHDLIARRRDCPVPALWGRTATEALRLSWTLNPRSLDEVEPLVEAGRTRGYRDFNIKVAPNPDFDVELALKARALAPDGFLWADANGGYEPETALAVAPRLAEAGVDVLEAPLKPNRIAGYRALKKQGALPIYMDEGVISPRDLEEFIGLDMLDGVAMKPSRCGGLRSARGQIELLEAHGLGWLGSGLTDPDVSLAATLQLYGAYGLERPAACNGPQFISDTLLVDPFVVRDGTLTPPAGPGFGVELDEDKLVSWTHARTSSSESASAGTSETNWDESKPGSFALQRSGADLWRFHHDSDNNHAYFHPLALPGGRVLTADAPDDHVHHHGLWFAWKYINGVNFWEHAPGTSAPAGRTRWELLFKELRGDLSARFDLRFSYLAPSDEILLVELRTLEVTAPDDEGAFEIRWASDFTAIAEEVHLDRTPLPGEKGGRIFGGYAGLSLRLAQLDERGAMTDAGVADFSQHDRFRTNASAFDYQGELAGQPVGIAIVAAPTNFDAPPAWYSIRSKDMSFVTPAVLAPGPLKLERGRGLGLRYRILIHPGHLTPATLQRIAVPR